MSNGQTQTELDEHLPPFFADLRLLLSTDRRDVARTAIEQLSVYLEATSVAAREHLAAALASNASSEVSVVQRIFQTLVNLSSTFSPGDEVDPARVALEFVENSKEIAGDNPDLQLSTDELDSLRSLVAYLAEQTTKWVRAIGTRGVLSGISPMFDDLEATVELRVAQWPLDSRVPVEPPPKLVPIASLRLELDSGSPDTVCFQATELDLAAMIGKLQRLQIAMSTLRQRILASNLMHDA